MIAKFTRGTGGTQAIITVQSVRLIETTEASFVLDYNIPQDTSGIATPSRLVLSLGQIKRSFTISGYVNASCGTYGGSARTYADEVVQDLRDMVKNTNSLTLAITTNDGSPRVFRKIDNTDADIIGYVQKVQVTSDPSMLDGALVAGVSDIGDRPDRYDVQIAFIEASDATAAT